MKVRIAAAIVVIGTFGTRVVLAATPKYDGNELLTQCQQYIRAADGEARFNQVDAGVCAGYVQGVESTVSFYSDDLANDTKFCVPDGVTNGQLVRIVVKYLKDNPKQLNLARTGLVWSALKDAYPCQ